MGNSFQEDVSSLAAKIDNTLLKPFVSGDKIIEFCQESKKYNFACVCVNPCHVQAVYDMMQDSIVKICTVIGFPLGAGTTLVKLRETEDAISHGADELDLVINIGWLKSGAFLSLEKEINTVVNAAGERSVKVIIETCYLNYKDKVEACRLILNTGASFIKTSTGFGTGGATLEDVRLLRELTGSRKKIKAAGGISNLRRTLAFLEAGADRIGTSRGIGIINELRQQRRQL